MTDAAGIDAVLFDMDGTLLNSRQALLGAFHDATTEVLGAAFPVTKKDADRIIQLSAREVFPAPAEPPPAAAERAPASPAADATPRA